MFKDLGITILVKLKLYKVLAKIYPYLLIATWIMLFMMGNMYENNKVDGNALQQPQLQQSLKEQINNLIETHMLNLDRFNISQAISTQMESLNLEMYSEQGRILGKLRAKRSPQFECNLITFYYDEQNIRSAAIVLAYIEVLQNENINYLSKDILFLAIPKIQSQYGVGINAFLESYTFPTIQDQYKYFPRAGQIRQGLHVDVDDKFDSIAIKLFGLNGRVPDRDFFLGVNIAMQKTQLPYSYVERDYRWIRILEKKLENLIRQLWTLLQLDSVYRLPAKVINIARLFPHLLESVEGDLHEAHGYMWKYGIPAVTIRGYNSQSKLDSIKNLSAVLCQVLEASNRVYMALDEHLHMGYTLYMPLNNDQNITIKQLVLPMALFLTCIVIPILKEYINAFHINKKAGKNEIIMPIVKASLLTLLGFALSSTTDYNLMLIYFVVYIIFVFGIRKYLFNVWTMPRTYAIFQTTKMHLNLLAGLTLIFAAILNIGIAFLIGLFVPCLLTVQSIRPRPQFNIKQVPSYLLNLMWISLIVYGLYNIGLETVIQKWEQIRLNHIMVGTHLYYYVTFSLIPFIITFVEILIF